ncbi:1109_t:CDS:2, partial [Funneliformis mosseae]
THKFKIMAGQKNPKIWWMSQKYSLSWILAKTLKYKQDFASSSTLTGIVEVNFVGTIGKSKRRDLVIDLMFQSLTLAVHRETKFYKLVSSDYAYSFWQTNLNTVRIRFIETKDGENAEVKTENCKLKQAFFQIRELQRKYKPAQLHPNDSIMQVTSKSSVPLPVEDHSITDEETI